MVEPGLRERKKARTRRLIADAAARLFGEHGYENVAVVDVAREADVAEQTVYNYFPTKDQLVVDRDEPLQERLRALILGRAPGVSPAAAVRPLVLDMVDGIRDIPPDVFRGELGHLAAISPTVHRLALETVDRLADAMAAAIADTTPLPPELCRLRGIALAAPVGIIISEAGRRTLDGQTQERIAIELRPMIENVLDELDRWLSET